MPTYDYTCRACRSDFDIFRSFSDKSAVRCPKCGKSRVERRISAPHFILKGSGFYVTEHKNASASKAESPANPKPESKTEAKTETKTKTETKPAKAKS